MIGSVYIAIKREFKTGFRHCILMHRSVLVVVVFVAVFSLFFAVTVVTVHRRALTSFLFWFWFLFAALQYIKKQLSMRQKMDSGKVVVVKEKKTKKQKWNKFTVLKHLQNIDKFVQLVGWLVLSMPVSTISLNQRNFCDGFENGETFVFWT